MKTHSKRKKGRFFPNGNFVKSDQWPQADALQNKKQDAENRSGKKDRPHRIEKKGLYMARRIE